MRIAMLGTRGVPARYGGFETCVEEVGRRLVDRGHEVVVYCRSAPGERRRDRPTEYRGMELVHLPAARIQVAETLSHTALSVLHLAFHRADAVFMFNSANSPFLPVIRLCRIPVAIHVDGLEWQRAKWGRYGKRYYRLAESLAVRWSDALIADARGIAAYYREKFDADSDFIAYGAPLLDLDAHDRLAAFELSPEGYHLVVARFEPENHVDVIVEGYVASTAKLPLIVVGAAPYSNVHTAAVHELADDRVTFLGNVWDQRLLDQLYANAFTYLHGHSVGGTNPSLLRALGAAAPTIAFDVEFNREVLQGSGLYFSDVSEVAQELELAEANPDETRERGGLARQRAGSYQWADVAAAYEALAERLVASKRSRRLNGRARERAEANSR